MSSHASLTGADLHQPWHYVQETDPGAIGAGGTWFKKSAKTLSFRNDANTGWNTILTSTNENALPDGTTWTEFVNAVAATDPGDTLLLPNSTIDQEAAIYGLNWKAMRIRGSGPASTINMVVQDFAQFGIGFAGVTDTPLYLENFTMRHDRAALGSAGRILTLYVNGGTYGLHVTGMNFVDITSDVFIHVGNTPEQSSNPLNWVADGIYFRNNTCTEWYESFINMHAFRGNTVKNVYFENNVCTLTARHPNGAVSLPYGVNIDPESDAGETIGGLLQNCHIIGNSLTTNGWGQLGVSIKSSATGADLCYNNLHIVGNTFDNWSAPCQIVTIHSSNDIGAYDAIPAFIYVYGNTFKWPTVSATARLDPAGLVDDIIFFGDNDMYFTSGKVGISEPGSWGPNVVVTKSPPNRDHEV